MRLGLASAVVGIAVCAVANSTIFAADRPLRVATGATAPFVLRNTNPPAGFSIDLWREIASRLGVEYSWNIIAAPPERLQPELRKPINKALLSIHEDGTYENIYARWFSRGDK